MGRKLSAGVAVWVTLACPAVWGAQWTGDADISSALLYTDNPCLDDDKKTGQAVGLLTPSVALDGEGRRFSVKAKGNVQFNSLSNSQLKDLGCGSARLDDRDQIVPTLFIDSGTELVRDWLDLYVDASIQQTQINPYLRGSGGSLNLGANFTTIYRYRINPRLLHRFGNAGTLSLDYSFDSQKSQGSALGGSDWQNVDLRWNSDPSSSRFTYGLRGTYSEISYSETPGRVPYTSELAALQASAGYQLGRQWQINALVGEEFNDFISLGENIDGTFWDVGVRWTPSIRTTVEVGTGERFFGSTPRASIEYRHKRSILRVAYATTLTYDRNLRTFDPADVLGDEAFLPGLPNPDGTYEFLDDPTTVTNSPIINESLSALLALRGRKSRLTLSSLISEQLRTEDARKDLFKRASLSAERYLSSRDTLEASLIWLDFSPEREEVFLEQAAVKTWIASLNLRRSLTSRATVLAGYQFIDRESEGQNLGYQENRISIELKYQL